MTNEYIELTEEEFTAATAEQQILVCYQWKKDHKVLFLLYQDLDEAIFEKVVEVTLSKQVWDTLSIIFTGTPDITG
jgi:hypothetical protein